MAFYDKFPYTNFQELNLDRIIQQLMEVKEGLKFVIDNASLKYADPIQWNITSQYQANTVVIDPATNIAYLSTKPVPDNILITDTNYWTPIFDLSDTIESIAQDYEALDNKIDGEIENRTEADTTLQNNIDEEIENRTEADTTLQNNIDAVIPETGTAGMILTKTEESYEWQMPAESTIAAMRKKMMVHRGFTESGNQYAQDNSIIALNLAGQYGFGGFECDPRKDVNGNIVLLHDADVSSVSNSTGNINTLNYADVAYKSKYNNIINVGHMTTLHEAILIAQNYDMFIMFDMGKNIVTVAEIEEECEKLDFRNYGFFNTTSTAAMRDLPDYVLKVCGNDVFTHTSEELANYIDILGTSENVAVRLLQGSISRSQCELIKNAGFKIVLNYTEYFSIDPALYDYVDFILADTVFSDDLMFTSKRAFIVANEDFTTCIDKLSGNYSGVVIDYRNTGANDLPTTSSNYIVVPVNLTSPNWRLVFAFEVPTGFIYARMKFGGTWKRWVQLSNVSLNQ